MSDNRDINKWANETSETLVKAMVGIIRNCPRPKSNLDLSYTLFFKIISLLTKVMLKQTLNEYKKQNLRGEEAYEFTLKCVESFKYQYQTSVCKGFEIAMAEYSGKFYDYYCIIKPVGDAANKEAC